MVIGAPRSGTAWASVFLTTEHSVCLHDPLWDHYYKDLDKIPCAGKQLGIACTGFGFYPEWLNHHPARKVVLHRELSELVASAKRLGMPPPEATLLAKLHQIQGLHVDWTDLFENPLPLYEYLLRAPFVDRERHRQLVALKITSRWEVRRDQANAQTIERYARDGLIIKMR